MAMTTTFRRAALRLRGLYPFTFVTTAPREHALSSVAALELNGRQRVAAVPGLEDVWLMRRASE
jgi:hypothetical protein